MLAKKQALCHARPASDARQDGIARQDRARERCAAAAAVLCRGAFQLFAGRGVKQRRQHLRCDLGADTGLSVTFMDFKDFGTKKRSPSTASPIAAPAAPSLKYPTLPPPPG